MCSSCQPTTVLLTTSAKVSVILDDELYLCYKLAVRQLGMLQVLTVIYLYSDRVMSLRPIAEGLLEYDSVYM